MSQKKEEKQTAGKATQWIQLLVVVIALAIVAYFVIQFVIDFMWWIVAFLAIAVLLINRKMVARAFNYLKGLYKKNTVLGVTGTVGGIVAFVPFLGFLLLKTIWDFRKSKTTKDKKTENNEQVERVDLGELETINDANIDHTSTHKNTPPTQQ